MERKIIIDIANSKFKESNKAIYYNTKKIDILLESLIKSSDAFYTSQVLTRVILEHFLLGHYIWIKSYTDDNDQCGVEYNMHYFCSEFFKRENYQVTIDNIHNNEKGKVDFNVIKARNPELNEMKQSDLENLHKIANQFDIRKIGDYLINNIPATHPLQKLHVKMLGFLEKYNFLSSYVHGGPFSEKQTFSNDLSINQEQIMLDNISWGHIASKQTKVNLLFSLERDFSETYKQPLLELVMGE